MDYIGWVNSHGIEVMASMYIFIAMVSSLPSPTANSSALFRFVFTFLHTLAGSIGRIPYFRNIVADAGMQTTTQTATVTTTTPVPSDEKKET